jgi:uncharacterized membrane protein YdjX (TVP38/TMEM64 family)
MQRRTLWIAAASIGGVALLLLAWFLLPLDEWLQGFGEWARGLGAAGVALVCVAYVLATLALVPGFPMTLAVAVAYGWWALAICFGGGMVAALVAFLLARYVARERVQRFLDRHRTAKAVDSVAREETFKTILLARLTPVTPFALENYAFGVTGVRLGAYLAATAIGIVPGTILNVWIGVIGRTAAQGGAGAASWALLVVGLAAAVILSVWLTRRARRKLRHEGAGAR